MRAKRVEPTNLELAQRLLGVGYEDYIPADPEHNAINLLLKDLGKGDLSPEEVEALCRTAKVMTIDGFVRLDGLPCGCWRVYRGLLTTVKRTADGISIGIGGIEGVKPCAQHARLIDSIKIREREVHPKMF